MGKGIKVSAGRGHKGKDMGTGAQRRVHWGEVVTARAYGQGYGGDGIHVRAWGVGIITART